MIEVELDFRRQGNDGYIQQVKHTAEYRNVVGN